MLGGAHGERGHLERAALAHRQGAGREAHDEVAPRRPGFKPHVCVVASLHDGARQRFLRRGDPGVEGGAQLAAPAVLPRHDVEAPLVTGVVVVRVDAAPAAPVLGPHGVFGAAPLFALKPREFAFCLLAARLGRLPLAELLLAAGGVGPGAHGAPPALHEQAAPRERVEQRAVVRDEQAAAAVDRKCLPHERAGGRVEEVRGLVEHEQVGFLNQGAGNLQALALSGRKGLEPPGPVVLDAEQAAQRPGSAPPVARKVGGVGGKVEDLLLAVGAGGVRDARHAARVGDELAACEPGDGRLAAAVGADDAGPAGRKRRVDMGDGLVGHAGIGVRDAAQGDMQRHGNAPWDAVRRRRGACGAAWLEGM